MKYHVLLRDTGTGETRWCRDQKWIDNDGDGPETLMFMWTEGNYGCDCNRALFFERVVDKVPEWEEQPCGDWRYKLVRLETDHETLIDEEWNV